MRRMDVLLGMLGIVLSGAALAQSLITEDEMRQEERAQASIAGRTPVRTRAAPNPGAPKIEIISPNIQQGAVNAPFEIRLKFQPESGAEIVPDSFRVFYGAFGLDITKRVMQVAEFKNNMLRVEKASIPAGKHRLTLKIMDTQQREAQQDLTVSVKE